MAGAIHTKQVLYGTTGGELEGAKESTNRARGWKHPIYSMVLSRQAMRFPTSPTDDSFEGGASQMGLSARGDADEASRSTSRVIRERSI